MNPHRWILRKRVFALRTARKQVDLFASKEKGGISFERFGEEIVWANEELVHNARTRGDLYRFLREGAEMRRAEEDKAIDDAEAEFIYEAYHMSVEEYEAWLDQMKEKALSLQEYEELQDQIAEEYDKQRTQEEGGRRAEPLSVNEKRGEISVPERGAGILSGERSGDRRGDTVVDGIWGAVESAGAESGSAQDAGYVKNANFVEDEMPERISQASDGADSDKAEDVLQSADQLRRGIEEASRDARGGEKEINRAIETLAKDLGLWIPFEDLSSLGRPFIGGNENTNYLDKNGTIYKVNNLMNSGTIVDLFKRIDFHNVIFPNTRYEFVGVSGFGNGGSIYPIYKQSFVRNAEFATPEEIDFYMRALGFEKTSKEAEYSNGEYIISDLRPRNVLRDADGDIYVIDAGLEVVASVSDRIAEEREKVDPNPTEAQKSNARFRETIDAAKEKEAKENEHGWFDRVLSEQQLPDERTDSKVKGVPMEFVSDGSDGRLPLTGVHHSNGRVAASDGYVFISEESKYPKKEEGKVKGKGAYIEVKKYPDVDRVIPKAETYSSFDADALVSFVERVETATKQEWGKKDESGKRIEKWTYKSKRENTHVALRINGEERVVRLDGLDKIAKAAKRLGISKVGVDSHGTIHMTDGNNHVVCVSNSVIEHLSNVPDSTVFAYNLANVESEDGDIRFRLSEEERIKKQAIADGTFMKAPNGNPTNLNERQWLQVRTKAFKDWFGDWEKDQENASKVVDENGEPLVVYHGTNNQFYEFRNTQENDAGWLGDGNYFFGDRSLDG